MKVVPRSFLCGGRGRWWAGRGASRTPPMGAQQGGAQHMITEVRKGVEGAHALLGERAMSGQSRVPAAPCHLWRRIGGSVQRKCEGADGRPFPAQSTHTNTRNARATHAQGTHARAHTHTHLCDVVQHRLLIVGGHARGQQAPPQQLPTEKKRKERKDTRTHMYTHAHTHTRTFAMWSSTACSSWGGMLADSRHRPSSSHASTANEKTSTFSLYALPRATSGAMYMTEPQRPVVGRRRGRRGR